MRRIGDLFAELGFRKDAPEGTQRAFLKHLTKTAEVAQTRREIRALSPEGEQLSFAEALLQPARPAEVETQPGDPKSSGADKKVG